MKTGWNLNYVNRIRGLKTLSDQQRLIIILFEKQNLSKNEERDLTLLLKAERSRERAKIAEAEAAQLISARKDTERKIVSQKLIQLGSLIEASGQGKKLPAEIVGCLHSSGQASETQWKEWRSVGERIISEWAKKARTA